LDLEVLQEQEEVQDLVMVLLVEMVMIHLLLVEL
jgi:hypothetical protein